MARSITLCFSPWPTPPNPNHNPNLNANPSRAHALQMSSPALVFFGANCSTAGILYATCLFDIGEPKGRVAHSLSPDCPCTWLPMCTCLPESNPNGLQPTYSPTHPPTKTLSFKLSYLRRTQRISNGSATKRNIRPPAGLILSGAERYTGRYLPTAVQTRIW